MRFRPLLRVLEERGVVRLGEHHMRLLDLRLVALTRADLRELTLDGSFRPELYFRIAGISIQLPVLRETGNDISLIFTHFVTEAARRANLPVPAIDYALRQRPRVVHGLAICANSGRRGTVCVADRAAGPSRRLTG